jgi:hypothetical protein
MRTRAAGYLAYSHCTTKKSVDGCVSPNSARILEALETAVPYTSRAESGLLPAQSGLTGYRILWIIWQEKRP